MRFKSKGFTVVEVIAVIAVVGLVVLAGVFLMQGDNKKADRSDSTSQRTDDEATEYASVRVSSVNDVWSISIPNGWSEVVTCTNSDSLFISAADPSYLTYDANTAPGIMPHTCGSDSTMAFAVYANPSDVVTDTVKGEPFRTANGLTGTKRCEKDVASSFADETWLLSCVYRFVKDKTTYDITYIRPDSNAPDRSSLVNQVVRSFSIE